MRHTDKKLTIITAALAIVLGASLGGCRSSTTTKTVQDYLRLLSGERPFTQASLEALTTEEYRSTEHAHLVSVAEQHRGQVIDLAEELRENPAIREFLELIRWQTTYEVLNEDETTAQVVARVIMVPKGEREREAALAIPDLPSELSAALEQGLELPFIFDLRRESGRWKIDGFSLPPYLLPLFESPTTSTNQPEM